jgi:hypothetical protein
VGRKRGSNRPSGLFTSRANHKPIAIKATRIKTCLKLKAGLDLLKVGRLPVNFRSIDLCHQTSSIQLMPEITVFLSG